MTDQRVLTALASLDKKCIEAAEMVVKMRQEIQALQKEIMQVGETGTFMAIGRPPKPPPRPEEPPRNIGLPPMG